MWAGFGMALFFLGLFTLVAIAAYYSARDILRLTVGLGAFAFVAVPAVYLIIELMGLLWGIGGYWATLLGLTGLLSLGMFAVIKWGN